MIHISEIKEKLHIDNGIVPKIIDYQMQKHDEHHKLWAQALAIYSSSKVAFNLKTSNSIRRLNVRSLSGTPVMNVSAYIQNIPNVTSNEIYQNSMRIWLLHLSD